MSYRSDWFTLAHARLASRTPFLRLPMADIFRNSLFARDWQQLRTMPRRGRLKAVRIFKLRVVLKELNEARTWLEQIVVNGLLPEQNGRDHEGER
jgi:hypothetical protein